LSISSDFGKPTLDSAFQSTTHFRNRNQAPVKPSIDALMTPRVRAIARRDRPQLRVNRNPSMRVVFQRHTAASRTRAVTPGRHHSHMWQPPCPTWLQFPTPR
jgi:hypothetical protein